MFFPLITRPTRITSNTATLIDNIFTNHLNNYSFSGLLFTDISDHLPIFCFTYRRTRINNNAHVVFCDKSETNIYIPNRQLRWEVQKTKQLIFRDNTFARFPVSLVSFIASTVVASWTSICACCILATIIFRRTAYNF